MWAAQSSRGRPGLTRGSGDIVSSVKDLTVGRGWTPAQDAAADLAGDAAASPSVGAANPAGDPAANPAFAADLLTAISAVRRTTRRAVRHASPTEPLPATRSELLRLTVSRPGITVAEAAREMRLAPNTVSTIVGSLATQGLITRGRSRADGRTVRLTPTARARQRLAQWRDLRAELAGHALAGLPASDQEALSAAIPALMRLAELMEDPAANAAGAEEAG
jgi:DNA-binding MarR family transcriptional regulator